MSKDDNGSGRGGPGTSVITKVKPKTKRPNLYRVLILNDDYTPMEFVVHVLEKFFNKDVEAATTIMLHVHHHGIGECGVFTYEIAETKVTQVMDLCTKTSASFAMCDGKEVAFESPARTPGNMEPVNTTKGGHHEDRLQELIKPDRKSERSK